MKRFGSVLGLSEDGKAEYRELHAAVWPEVLAKITECNIRNYSIFLKEPENLLFSVFEYHGTDYAADMAKMKLIPEMLEWWKITDPMQIPFETRKPGEWWAGMENVFHTDQAPRG